MAWIGSDVDISGVTSFGYNSAKLKGGKNEQRVLRLHQFSRVVSINTIFLRGIFLVMSWAVHVEIQQRARLLDKKNICRVKVGDPHQGS